MVGDAEVALHQYHLKGGYAYPFEFFSQELGIPRVLAKKISDMHVNGRSALGIAQEITPWTVVKEKIKKPNLYQRLRAWWFRSKPSPQPALRLVTN
jgi:GH43 family beta-xylosidase